MRSMWLRLVAVLSLLFLFGCGEYGKVDQGRCVAYDKDKKAVTMIRDVKNDAAKPEYTHLPAIVYTMPSDPKEVGPDPKAGGRMKLDPEKNEIVLFDSKAQNFVHIPFTMVEKKDNVGKEDELVKDKKLPAIDNDKKTVTIYSGRQKLYMVVQVDAGAVEKYNEKDFDSGDECRVYYKEDGKALRFMNVSKTDIFKK